MDTEEQSVINNLTEAVLSFGPLIHIIVMIIGVFMVGWGVFMIAKLKRPTGSGSSNGTAAIVAVSIGGILLVTPTLIDMFSDTFGSDHRAQILLGENWDELGDVAADEEPQLADAVRFAFAVIAIIGFVGFIRGWLVLNRIAKSGQSPGQSLGHASALIVGGILAINIPWTFAVIANTFGSEASNYVMGIL